MKTKHFFSALLCASVVIGLISCRTEKNDPAPNKTDYADLVVGTWQMYYSEGWEDMTYEKRFWYEDWETNEFNSYTENRSTVTTTYNDSYTPIRNTITFSDDGRYSSRWSKLTIGTYEIKNNILYYYFDDYGEPVTDEDIITLLTNDELVLEYQDEYVYDKRKYYRIK